MKRYAFSSSPFFNAQTSVKRSVHRFDCACNNYASKALKNLLQYPIWFWSLSELQMNNSSHYLLLTDFGASKLVIHNYSEVIIPVLNSCAELFQASVGILLYLPSSCPELTNYLNRTRARIRPCEPVSSFSISINVRISTFGCCCSGYLMARLFTFLVSVSVNWFVCPLALSVFCRQLSGLDNCLASCSYSWLHRLCPVSFSSHVFFLDMHVDTSHSPFQQHCSDGLICIRFL